MVICMSRHLEHNFYQNLEYLPLFFYEIGKLHNKNLKFMYLMRGNSNPNFVAKAQDGPKSNEDEK